MSSTKSKRPWRILPSLASFICWCGSFGALVFCTLGISAFVAPDFWFADNMSFFLRQFLAAGLLGCAAGALGLLLPHRLSRLYKATFALALAAFLGLAAASVARTLENTAETRAAAPNGHSLKIISINVERLFLGDRRLTRFLEREKPDIVVLQEVMWWLQERRWERLELPVGSKGENGFPEFLSVGSGESLVIYSSFPILQTRSEIVLGDLHEGASVTHEADREILKATLDTGDRRLNLILVHPDSPRNHVRWQNKRRYFEETDKTIHGLQEGDAGPLLVVGDWNSAPWSARFQKTLTENNLKTAYPGGWPRTTRFFFDHRLHWILGAPVDQFAVSQDINVLSVSTGPHIGSDHLPLIVEIELPAKN
ncbi:MAG: endonuclease/exonuclease/phosphatase family protein [Roseibium sp.]|uniref:endonuclease/exonuclease/phosphatase family protein n=1 Tax=Roseibium sp. TaxID=1936156 RepID=UPI003D9C4AC7